MISTLTRLGIHALKNLGEWRSIEDGTIIFAMPPDPPDADRIKWSNAAKWNWECLREVMKTIDIRWLVEGPIDLLISRRKRQSRAEDTIKGLTSILHLLSS